MKTTIQTELPDELVSQARSLVDQGWAGDFDELLTDALRRYLESHSSELSESFIRQDVAWGLSGHE
ncbi:MAG: CopG family transcriptional regulator [Acidobacteriota bacterium]